MRFSIRPFSRMNVRSAFSVAFVAIAALFLSQPAFALTLGEVMCNSTHNFTPVTKIITGLAYIAGAIAIGRGLLMLATITESRETKLHNPIMHLVGGAAMLAFPATMNLILHSIFNISGGGGISACTGDLPSSASSGIGLDGLMINLIGNIKDPMTFMLSAIAIVIGAFLVLRGLMKASKYGLDPKSNSVANILANLVIGAVLFAVGTSLGVLLNTMFGDSNIQSYNILSWSNLLSTTGVDTTQFQVAIYAALTFFQLIGFIAFIRGFLILKNAIEGSGQATMAQGLTHILGGVCAINIYYFLQVMDNTFGTGFLS